MSLGITEEQTNEILRFISDNDYCGIIAPTGSGKSTLMIENLIKAGAQRIFITEPTIPAAEKLFEYMSVRLGRENVGFAAEGNIRYNSSTRVIYCTAGHLRRKMLNYYVDGEIKSGSLNFCDIIVLDEAHNGSIDNDAITELYIKAYNDGVSVPKLVLASATLSKESTSIQDLPIYEIKTKSYPVEIEYAVKDYQPDSRDIYVDMTMAIINRHLKNPVSPKGFSKWLVFCAGSNEVENVCNILRDASFPNVNVLPVYSNLPSEQISRISEPVPAGFRNIIVSTNIAEASITIDGLDAVFDSLTEKVGETSSSGGLRLVVKHVSKSSAAQRKGRTGRTGPGYCYRMCTEYFFKTLQEQREPEIVRVPLTNLVVEFLNVGLNPIELFGDRVSVKKMQSTLKKLRELDMIDKQNKVTEIGDFATKFPLAVQNSALIYNWLKMDKDGVEGRKYPVYPMIVLASLIDSYGPSYFYYPKKEDTMTYKEYELMRKDHYSEYFKKYSSDNDLKSLLMMWNEMIREFETISPPSEAVFKWSQSHSFNNKKIQEVFKVVKQCCKIMSTLPATYSILTEETVKRPVVIGNFNEDKFLKVAGKIMLNVYKNSIYMNVKDGVYLNRITNEYYKIDRKQAINPNLKVDYPRIISLRDAQIGTGKTVNNIISLSFPI